MWQAPEQLPTQMHLTDRCSPLTADDLARLSRSGISTELAQEALLRRVDSAAGSELVGRSGIGDYAGIVFPYVWPGELHVREYRLRRDHPDLEQQPDGPPKERAKYLWPPGRGNRLYFVPGTAAAWLSDISLPVFITEGEKKTLALWSLACHDLSDAAELPRWLPIGLAGVWGWRGTVGKETGPDGDRRDVKGVIPDFDHIKWRGRRVMVVFDANVSTNESVAAARRELSRELNRRSAVVEWIDLPEVDGVNGIDDLAGQWGPDKTLSLIQTTAKSPNTARPPVREGPYNPLADYAMDDSGNALRFADKFKDQARFCPEDNVWYVWDGMRWCRDLVKHVQQLAKTLRDDWMKLAEQCIDHKMRAKLENFAPGLRWLEASVPPFVWPLPILAS
jgi:hypothetical protein